MGAEIISNGLPWLTIHDCRETMFFSRHEGRLCQWVELDLSANQWRPDLTIEVRSGRRKASHHVVFFPTLGQQRATVRAYAPARWPEGADGDARLAISAGGARLEARITVGTQRPWTVYALSDLCADDTWAFDDLERHDREDYLTTLAELDAGAENRYNFAANYQVHRFQGRATAAERSRLKEALRSGRFYATPTPNQLNCGAFLLAAYPLLLEPFRRFYADCGLKAGDWPRDAYHMEAPTWTNGYVSLLASAGFRSFGKSLLGFSAPWLEGMKALPRLTRLEVSPGRFMYLLWRIGDYSEASPVLAGPPYTNEFLHGKVIPSHEALGDRYPTSAIPLVGAYSDLAAATKGWAAVKVEHVRQYNGQGWEYPRLVNGTWPQFFDHVQREVGPAPRKGRGSRKATGALVSVRGDIGSSWEAWMLAAAAEHGAFRRAQRDVVSLRTLGALLAADGAVQRKLEEISFELVQLGDHAWNGSSVGSRALNLGIRRGRLEKLRKGVTAIRRRWAPRSSGRRFAVVNTLGWTRACRVNLANDIGADAAHLADPATDEAIVIRTEPFGDPPQAYAMVPEVPGFGARVVEVRGGGVAAMDDQRQAVLPPEGIEPTLEVEGQGVEGSGGWKEGGRGSWTVGPFSIEAAAAKLDAETDELTVSVRGVPPEKPHDLRLRMKLPFERCRWRGESGGGFVTPGPVEGGGDSLLGIVGPVFAAGEGLRAVVGDGSGAIDLALGESGICRLGAAKDGGAPQEGQPKAGDNRQWPWVWTQTESAGELHWCLLGNGQNPREAFGDQGGVRSWVFRCGLRRREGGVDDAALYRFAAAYNRVGEVLDVRSAARLPRWNWRGATEVLVLGAHREGKMVAFDLYNTADKPRTVMVDIKGAKKRRVVQADMLSRTLRGCPSGRVTVGPKAYSRVLIS